MAALAGVPNGLNISQGKKSPQPYRSKAWAGASNAWKEGWAGFGFF